MLWFVLTAVFFVLNGKLGGWGHSLSHLALGPFAAATIAAGTVAAVPEHLAEGAAELVRGAAWLARDATALLNLGGDGGVGAAAASLLTDIVAGSLSG